MTTAHDIDWPQVLAERLTTTHPDVLRELLATFIHTLAEAVARALIDQMIRLPARPSVHQRTGYEVAPHALAFGPVAIVQLNGYIVDQVPIEQINGGDTMLSHLPDGSSYSFVVGMKWVKIG